MTTNLAERAGALLEPALERIAQEIDESFDALLPMPNDPRDRLVEAMRYGRRQAPAPVAGERHRGHVWR
jgi:hypothetical protein